MQDDIADRLNELEAGYREIVAECDRMLATVADADDLIALWQTPELATAA